MPKITAGGGPSHVDAEPGQPGYRPPAELEGELVLKECGQCSTQYAADLDVCPHCGAAQAAEVAGPAYLTGADPDADDPEEPEEGLSPGSSSSTSDETPPSKPASSGTGDPKPAPTTVSPSPKAPGGRSGAGSTAGSGRRTPRRGSPG